MVRTFQLTKSLAKMTVIDNMLLGAAEQKESPYGMPFFLHVGKTRKTNFEKAEDLLGRFKLSHMRDEYAATLSRGQRKLLEMARL